MSTPPPEFIPNEMRQRIRDYFDGKYEEKKARLAAINMSTKRLRRVLLVIGALVILAGATAAAAGWLEFGPFKGTAAYAVLGILVGVLIIATRLLVNPSPELPGRDQVEAEVVIAREHDAQAMLARAGRLLAGDGGESPQFGFLLIGYPDKKRCQELRTLVEGKISREGQPLLTPVTVTAARLADRSMAVYQGTVDLTNGRLLFDRLAEYAYRDIISLERVSEAPAATGKDGQAVQPVASVPGRFPSDRDFLAINFADGQSTRITLRDADFSAQLKGSRLPLASDQENVERFWQALRRRWHETRGAGQA